LKVVESISHETVRKEVKKMSSFGLYWAMCFHP
jgi:hypothetical protein